MHIETNIGRDGFLVITLVNGFFKLKIIDRVRV